jgi:hypothetical protein
MPLVASPTKPDVFTYDAWGRILRRDWVPYTPGGQPSQTQTGYWAISGENIQPHESVHSPSDPALLAGFGLGTPMQSSPQIAQYAGAGLAGAPPGLQAINVANPAAPTDQYTNWITGFWAWLKGVTGL